MTIRTSLTHPLQIAELVPPHGSGRIGITFCPGKTQPHAMSGAWNRDLGTDLDAIKAWGATTVITLIEAHEVEDLRVQPLGEEVTARGMGWLHLPIRDASIPDSHFEAAWAREIQRLLASVLGGARVLVHCKGGLGRAGTIAARLMIELGMEPTHAIGAVRAVRPGAIETWAQEDYLKALSFRLRGA